MTYGEKCPLSLGGVYAGIPEICESTCSPEWEHSVAQGRMSGPYDLYENDEAECDAPTIISEVTLTAVARVAIHNNREYTVVDACAVHSVDVGEQSFAFTCPLELDE